MVPVPPFCLFLYHSCAVLVTSTQVRLSGRKQEVRLFPAVAFTSLGVHLVCSLLAEELSHPAVTTALGEPSFFVCFPYSVCLVEFCSK